jgi:GTP-binding protein
MTETTARRTPVIALVGRTNVGKSTLFNRLVEKKKAIMSDVEGTTTDIKFDHCHWRGKVFTVIDTAGLDLTKENATPEALKRQAMTAMRKADLIVFIVDLKDGMLPQDLAFARHLRSSKKPVIFVGNKADNPGIRQRANDTEWLKFGMGAPHALSAANGSAVGDLLDKAYDEFEKLGIEAGEELEKPEVHVAILGRPNVGKSSLLNALAGEERVIVSEVAHTTKEPQDTLVQFTDKSGTERRILLTDTVGIRKKGKVAEGAEKLGVSMSIEELRLSDVALLIIDAVEGVGMQEKKLAGLIERKWSGAIIIVNKWDLAKEKGLGDADDYRKHILGQLPFYAFAPVMFMSALTGARVDKVLDKVLEVQAERVKQITVERLEQFVEKLKKQHNAVVWAKGENKPKVYGITQTGIAPPTFTVVVKKQETVHVNFLRFIENRLREEFGFEGTPIVVEAREIKSISK